MADRPTIVRPPPADPSKSAIENTLELTELAAIGPDIYTNTRPLWHPPGARGIYGGAVIAQCLSAAQLTVPADFMVHSMHCYFVLAGDSSSPVLYYVEHVREGRSFATRTVQARQKGKCIFTTTMSFVREGSGGKNQVQHAISLPEDVKLEDLEKERQGLSDEDEGGSPFLSHRVEILNKSSTKIHEKRTRQWIKCRGRISDEGGHQAHLSALAYMSDSYFIGTVSRLHNLWRFGPPRTSQPKDEASKQKEDYINRIKVMEGFGDDLNNSKGRPEVGMMVSLDHSIYFHEPKKFRADEWMFTEMASPWSGDGRGVVQQHMFTADGTLVATCFQEGVVRLKEDKPAKASKL